AGGLGFAGHELAYGELVLRRRHALVDHQRPGHYLRPAQRLGGRSGDGLCGDSQHLLHCRRRHLQCAARPDPRLARLGRDALADLDPCGHPDRQPRHFLGADDRHGPYAHPGRQRCGGNAGVRSGRQSLPGVVPGGVGAADVHLCHEYLGGADSSAPAQAVFVSL
nr:hypothetical protein [Tanacetum cinerariifolium]